MKKMQGVNLTKDHRVWLKELARIQDRSMSSMVRELIAEAWAAHQERITETAGAQNPERLKPTN